MRWPLSICALLLFAFPVCAQPAAVGRLVAVTGEVWIDAFGADDFLPALENEVVYGNSVIRVGDGHAALIAGSRRTELAIHSPAAAADVAESGPKPSVGWFGGLIASLRGRAEVEESVALGTRAAPAAARSDPLFMTDDEALLIEARVFIEQGDYTTALDRLDDVLDPYYASDVAGEIHALTGAAHFGLRRYQQAIEPLQRALSENLDSLPGTRPMPQPEFERMLLQLSSALYVVGDKDAAWQPLTILTGTAGQTVAYDYGLLLQARILAENGRSAEACAHLRLAKEHDPPPQVTDALESQSRALSCR